MTQSTAIPTPSGAATETGTDLCTLYLVRHGTTTMNVENRYRGRRDIPLDAQGYQDAVDAARQLSGAGLGAVYAGGLRRTIATAQIIADEARVPDIRILPGLINVDYGSWEGMTAQEAEMFAPAAFKLYKTDPSLAVCPNGERLRDAQERMLEALRLMGSRHVGEKVAAVTHAVMIRLVVASIENISGEQWRIPVGRGSLTTMTIDQQGVIEVRQRPAGSDVD
ncbi:MAG TPA: histidine phosphatase family protein [Segeticoccus sp.]|uniref:histidine phosphatase family protein n=1 Tax=Segeticoccus sp. TaxID=2706531 RepID=UPI002D7F1898|nr:histidine phosphatase family protein [Segeticoccus sp.]HET8600720.1 histidine phosphatase family protein [Segeticoccus sp.]